jgi:hypothetical protein
MQSTYPPILSELVLNSESFSADRIKTVKYFEENILRNPSYQYKVLIERVKLLNIQDLTAAECQRLAKNIFLKQHAIVESDLEKLGSQESFFEKILSESEKPFNIGFFRNLTPNLLKMHLEHNHFSLLKRLLLKNDPQLTQTIPAEFLTNAILQALKVDPSVSHFITVERLLNLEYLFQYENIKDTLVFLAQSTHIFEPITSVCQLVLAEKAAFFEPVFFELITKHQDALLIILAKNLFETVRPSYKTIANEIIQKRFHVAKEPMTCLKKVEQNIELVMQHPCVLNFLKEQGLLTESLSIICAHKEHLGILTQLDSFQNYPLLDWIFELDIDPKLLDLYIPSLRDIYTPLDILKNVQQIDYSYVADSFPLLDMKNPHLIRQLLKNRSIKNNLETSNVSNTVLVAVDSYFLTYLNPLQLRDLFLKIKPPLIEQKTHQYCANPYIPGPFKEVYVQFYSTYFLRLNYSCSAACETFLMTFSAFFPDEMLDIFFVSMADPVLRRTIVDLIPYICDKHQQVLCPLLYHHELQKVCKYADKSRLSKLLPFFREDQYEFLLEYYAKIYTESLAKIKEKKSYNISVEIHFLERFKRFYSTPLLDSLIAAYKKLEQSQESEKIEPNPEQVCPITFEVPKKPVSIVYEDGSSEKQVYEKQALIKWVQTHHSSPVTRKKVELHHIKESSSASSAKKSLIENICDFFRKN